MVTGVGHYRPGSLTSPALAALQAPHRERPFYKDSKIEHLLSVFMSKTLSQALWLVRRDRLANGQELGKEAALGALRNLPTWQS